MSDNLLCKRSEKYGKVKMLCVELKISRSTFYSRIKSSPEFKNAVEKRLEKEQELELVKIQNT